MGQNFFQVLGCSPADNPRAISEAFRTLSRTMHPDAGGGVDDYLRLTEAYEVLKDEKRRGDYTRWLELTQTPCPNCKGLGIEWRQRGFSGGELVRCAHCKGGGFNDPGK